MEVYKDITSQQSKKFEELLNSETAKNKVEEGSIVKAEITNISEKFVWVHLGMKSEAMIEINEFKNLNQLDNIKVGQSIEVLLENSESKSGEIIVSLEKAHKQRGFQKLKKAFEDNQIITGEIIGKVKGGVIFKEKETGISTFMPGSQISARPLKDISSLMNTEIKAQIIKIDPIRGNLCTSRRAVQTAEKVSDKKEIFSRYKVGDILKDCLCKNIASFGAFFEVNEGEFDSLCHLQELSYSRINSPDEVLEVNKKYDLKIISIDLEKMQIGTSIKAMAPDPFDNVAEFEVGSDYTAVVKKILDYGIFVEIRSGLSALLHQSEISWTKKNINPKTFAKVNDRINVRITEIDKDKRRIAVSHKLTTENPWEKFKNEFPVDSIIDGEVTGINEYALFVKLGNFSLEGFLHCNDLAYIGKPEEEIKKFKKGDKLEKLKILECDLDSQKIRVSLKEAISEDPFKFYDNYKEGDVLTCKVVSIDNKGLIVKPEGSEIETFIKKSQLAIAPGDQRSGRWTNGDRVDCLLEKKEKRKITLSIRALEEKLNADALEKFGDSGSGKSLPFASLSDKIEKKKKSE
tara:strand:+ start:88 stop:1812 length:1725 start_codon:yes stop_codon:yes gene_type:complete